MKHGIFRQFEGKNSKHEAPYRSKCASSSDDVHQRAEVVCRHLDGLIRQLQYAVWKTMCSNDDLRENVTSVSQTRRIGNCNGKPRQQRLLGSLEPIGLRADPISVASSLTPAYAASSLARAGGKWKNDQLNEK